MSAFEFYAKINSAVDRKRKRKRRNNEIVKRTLAKKSGTEHINDSPNISRNNVLNNIYNSSVKNSMKTGQKLFEWLINPIGIDDFMK